MALGPSDKFCVCSYISSPSNIAKYWIYWWATGYDVEPAITRHQINMLCDWETYGLKNVGLMLSHRLPSRPNIG